MSEKLFTWTCHNGHKNTETSLNRSYNVMSCSVCGRHHSVRDLGMIDKMAVLGGRIIAASRRRKLNEKVIDREV